MHPVHLHEHDANQGAQSSGEFLGMTGNSGWYLLGSAGATILMVIFLWGIMGVSLLLCLLIGLALCSGSVGYVFALKNNKPKHYDTDFFESAMVEAGIQNFQFGPRQRRPLNPFSGGLLLAAPPEGEQSRSASWSLAPSEGKSVSVAPSMREAAPTRNDGKARPKSAVQPAEEPMVAQSVYEGMREQLADTQDLLEEALVERVEN